MKVLLVYPYLPHPDVSHGSGRLLAPLLRLWRDHAEVTLVCGYRPQEAGRLDAARALVHELHPVPRPLRSDLSLIGKMTETARTAARYFTRLDPFHVAKLDRIAFRRAIRTARARTRFDVAQVELSGVARCIAEFDGLPSVLVDHEAGAASGGDLSSDARSVRFVQKIYPRFTRIVALCREDAADLQAALPGIDVGVRRPGVMASPADSGRGEQPASAGRRTVLFFGSPDHLPNQDALVWLATELWPRISARVADARCVVTGGARSAKLLDLLAAAGIENKGFVPDLQSELAAAAVVVAPVRSGRGVRIKNLDTLAAGRPLVTTRLGARGLDLRDAGHAMIADGTSDFSDAVVKLLHDPGLAARLGSAGRDHVIRTFTHEAAAWSNLDLWKKLAAG